VDPAPISTGKAVEQAQYYDVDEVAHWSPIPTRKPASRAFVDDADHPGIIATPRSPPTN